LSTRQGERQCRPMAHYGLILDFWLGTGALFQAVAISRKLPNGGLGSVLNKICASGVSLIQGVCV
jgi:hypothetical protein